MVSFSLSLFFLPMFVHAILRNGSADLHQIFKCDRYWSEPDSNFFLHWWRHICFWDFSNFKMYILSAIVLLNYERYWAQIFTVGKEKIWSFAWLLFYMCSSKIEISKAWKIFVHFFGYPFSGKYFVKTCKEISLNLQDLLFNIKDKGLAPQIRDLECYKVFHLWP